jgi:hypothetical protein
MLKSFLYSYFECTRYEASHCTPLTSFALLHPGISLGSSVTLTELLYLPEIVQSPLDTSAEIVYLPETSRSGRVERVTGETYGIIKQDIFVLGRTGTCDHGI